MTKSYDEQFSEDLQNYNQRSFQVLKEQILILQEAMKEASQAENWEEAKKILADVPQGVALPQTPKKAQGGTR